MLRAEIKLAYWLWVRLRYDQCSNTTEYFILKDNKMLFKVILLWIRAILVGINYCLYLHIRLSAGIPKSVGPKLTKNMRNTIKKDNGLIHLIKETQNYYLKRLFKNEKACWKICQIHPNVSYLLLFLLLGVFIAF